MYLFIDTTIGDTIRVVFFDGDGKAMAEKQKEAKYRQSELLLPTIDEVLGIAGFTKADIVGIAVVKGPGSFTSLRVAMTTANTLGFALGVPVVGLLRDEIAEDENNFALLVEKLRKAKKGEWVMPEYGMEPNITVSKKDRG